MYTTYDIADILEPIIVQKSICVDIKINDFEINVNKVNNITTSLINISERSWLEWFNYKKVGQSNFKALATYKHKLGLVISDEILPENYKGNYIIVNNAFAAMEILAKYFRAKYKNPLVAITGSFGKSSTRIMLETVLKGYNVLHNIGNANMRIPILLNTCKLIRNPDFALFEVSLNALNNRGNMSELIRPDIAIITGIGEAHLSTMSGTEEIAKFKSRIFEGLTSSGIAIINQDTLHYDILFKKALKHTKYIRSYSLENKSCDTTIFTKSIQVSKGQMFISVLYEKERFDYILNSLSKGMIYNSLAVILTIIELKLDLKKSINNLKFFKPLPKVLEMKELTYQNNKYTLIDDTHNASLPAMINAIESFNNQSRYYSGVKIIALGKINDLGEESNKLHEKLVPLLTESQADYILCLDEELRTVVNKVKGKKITWYTSHELLLDDLCSLLTNDSLTLLKSSVTGTEFPKIAQRLPSKILGGFTNNELSYFQKYQIPSLNIIIENTSFESKALLKGKSIEGLSSIFYYIYAKSLSLKNREVKLKKWPTNNSVYVEGMTIMLHDLIECMIDKPHPSLVYQLANEIFKSEFERRKIIEGFIRKYNLSSSAIINVTGRHRIKERHQFSQNDLYILYKEFNDTLFDKKNMVLFGYDSFHGMIKLNNGVILFNSFNSMNELLSKVSGYFTDSENKN
ncbi:Mur ligase family protein [Staphylococcus chromogenes]|uniref:Mur ligase family protein n=1 Tax=Staphylococcus chromogenes TaxID=46126 RepID=UPI0028858850|nr:Mur ligase family protein [Staphylococcus chromogenes]MDT0748007.1 Mur ligase family protein [Staphylococcus chromogenes]MDY3360480.1 Mur ligase family protein [Clostridium celatum]